MKHHRTPGNVHLVHGVEERDRFLRHTESAMKPMNRAPRIPRQRDPFWHGVAFIVVLCTLLYVFFR